MNEDKTATSTLANSSTEEKLSESESRVVTRSKRKKPEETTEQHDTQVRWVQVRLLPIYVRILIVIALLVVAVIIGTMIGYSVLGDGAVSEVFHKETWTHIFDIMNGKE